MTNAVWCDPGGHPFPQGQPGSTVIKLSEQVKNQWGGWQPSDIAQDVCAACAKDLGYRGLAGKQDVSQEVLDELAEDQRERTGGRFFNRNKPGPKAVTSGSTVTDKTKEFEDENRDLRLDALERQVYENPSVTKGIN